MTHSLVLAFVGVGALAAGDDFEAIDIAMSKAVWESVVEEVGPTRTLMREWDEYRTALTELNRTTMQALAVVTEPLRTEQDRWRAWFSEHGPDITAGRMDESQYEPLLGSGAQLEIMRERNRIQLRCWEAGDALLHTLVEAIARQAYANEIPFDPEDAWRQVRRDCLLRARVDGNMAEFGCRVNVALAFDRFSESAAALRTALADDAEVTNTLTELRAEYLVSLDAQLARVVERARQPPEMLTLGDSSSDAEGRARLRRMAAYSADYWNTALDYVDRVAGVLVQHGMPDAADGWLLYAWQQCAPKTMASFWLDVRSLGIADRLRLGDEARVRLGEMLDAYRTEMMRARGDGVAAARRSIAASGSLTGFPRLGQKEAAAVESAVDRLADVHNAYLDRIASCLSDEQTQQFRVWLNEERTTSRQLFER